MQSEVIALVKEGVTPLIQLSTKSPPIHFEIDRRRVTEVARDGTNVTRDRDRIYVQCPDTLASLGRAQ